MPVDLHGILEVKRTRLEVPFLSLLFWTENWWPNYDGTPMDPTMESPDGGAHPTIGNGVVQPPTFLETAQY